MAAKDAPAHRPRPHSDGARGRKRVLPWRSAGSADGEAFKPLDLSVPVRCFATAAEAEAAAKEFHAHLHHVERPQRRGPRGSCVCPRRVGFDMEWSVTYVRGAPAPPTALIQMACHHICLLFHVSRCGVPPALRALLEDQHVIKTGVGIGNDAKKLRKDFGVELGGVVSIADAASECMASSPGRGTLAAWCEHVLKRTLPKDSDVRRGNWDRHPLTRTQMRYAALDAIASLAVYSAVSVLEPCKTTFVRDPRAVGDRERFLRMARRALSATPPQVPAAVNTRDVVTDLAVPGLSHTDLEARNVLQHSKLQLVKLWQQGLGLQEVSTCRGVSLSTAYSYILEGIKAGAAYRWGRLGISDEVQRTVAAAVRSVSRALTAATPLQPSDDQPGADWRRVRLRNGLFVEWGSGANMPNTGSPRGPQKRARVGTVDPAKPPFHLLSPTQSIDNGYQANSSRVTPVSPARPTPQPDASTHGTRTVVVEFPDKLSSRRVKQLLPEHITYTELHLTLAHMRRLSVQHV